MAQLNNLIVTGSSRFLNVINGNVSGTSSNVTGTVAIGNGGTGATTRLNALKALTNENVGTNATYFLTITDSWGKGGYSSVANVKTVLGLGSAAYTASTAYLASTTKYAASSSVGGAATSAAKLTNTSKIGDTNKPVYFTASGVPSAISYTIDKSVPSTAVFTDANVKQTATDSTSASYELLFSVTADNTTRTEGARKTCKLTFNPKNSEILLTNGDSTTLSTEGYTSICRHIGTNPSYFISRSPNGAKLDLVKNNSDGGVVKQLTVTEEDIELIGTNHTWDGTNTSLKTALSKKLGNTGSQTITNGSIYISTSTITTGVGFFAKNRNNIQCYLYCGDDSMGLYSDNGHGGIIRKFLSTNEVAINGARYSVANPANFRSAIGAAASSSRLTKKNIEDITEAEAKKILEIDVKSFDYKDAYILEGYPKRDKYYGVIAEDVLKQIPFVVNVPDDYDESKIDETKGLHQSLLTVDYDKFVPYLIKMVQIQQKEIEDLKQQLNKITN